jgi:hypothetical protein
MHAARGHAVVRGLDDAANATRPQRVLDCVGKLRRQPLLDLQTLRAGLNDTGELADADHAVAGSIGYPGPADDRRQVMFAVASRNECRAAQSLNYALPSGDRANLLLSSEESGDMGRFCEELSHAEERMF